MINVKDKEERKKKVDSMLLYDVVSSFLDEIEGQGIIKERVEYDKVINGKVVHVVGKSWSMTAMRNRLQWKCNRYKWRSEEPRTLKDTDYDVIHNIFGPRKNAEELFLEKLWYMYYGK